MTGEVSSRITDRQTDPHDNYRNPRRACAPRVKKRLLKSMKEMFYAMQLELQESGSMLGYTSLLRQKYKIVVSSRHSVDKRKADYLYP